MPLTAKGITIIAAMVARCMAVCRDWRPDLAPPAKLLSKDEARRIAVNIAKSRNCCAGREQTMGEARRGRRGASCGGGTSMHQIRHAPNRWRRFHFLTSADSRDVPDRRAVLTHNNGDSANTA
jgi:hypothetical protein